MDAMYKETQALGVIPMKDPLDGWGIDAKIAPVANYISKNIVREIKKVFFLDIYYCML